MKLLLDEMLGRTVKWLRIFGIDTGYASGRDDDELIKAAKEGNLVLVTMDEDLAKKAGKLKITVIHLKTTNMEEQLAALKRSLNLDFTFPEKTRCPACNHLLELVPGSEVSGLVNENVLKRHKKFWLCKRCNKAYWEGSHWPNITRIFESVMRLSGEENKRI